MSKSKLEELREMELTINKIQSMIAKSKEELKYLEVEWLQLRGLVAKDSSDKSKDSEAAVSKIEVNFDDVNQINSEQFNPVSLTTDNTLLNILISNSSENESSDDDE